MKVRDKVTGEVFEVDEAGNRLAPPVEPPATAQPDLSMQVQPAPLIPNHMPTYQEYQQEAMNRGILPDAVPQDIVSSGKSPADAIRELSDTLKSQGGRPDIGGGIMRGLDRQIVGGGQAAMQVGRWLVDGIGSPITPEEQTLQGEAVKLNQASRNAPLPERMAETFLPALEFAALPNPAGLAGVVGKAGNAGAELAAGSLGNALLGGIMGAIEPQADTGQRGYAAMRGATMGAAIPAVSGVLGMIGQKGRGMIDGQYGAMREITGELASKFGHGARPQIEIPSVTKSQPPIPPGDGMGPPAPPMGPPMPKFGYVPGIQPTAAMVSNDDNIRLLEQVARTRNGLAFGPRDEANQAAVYNAFEDRAFPDSVANQMQDAVNDKTGPIRGLAQQLADFFGGARDPVDNYLGGLRDYEAGRAINNVAAPIMEYGDSRALYDLRKAMDDRLRLGPNVAADEATNLIKANRGMATGLKQTIDQALNDRSFGLWGTYLKEHADSMAPIEEGRAFQNLLDRFSMNGVNPAGGLEGGIRKVTPAGLRRAEDSETWMNLGKTGYRDVLSTQGRNVVNDAVSAMDAQEVARNGVRGLNGSQTAPNVLEVLKQAFAPAPGTAPGMAYTLLNLLGQSKATRTLDNALLNPGNGQLAGILERYNAPQTTVSDDISALIDATTGVNLGPDAVERIGRGLLIGAPAETAAR